MTQEELFNELFKLNEIYFAELSARYPEIDNGCYSADRGLDYLVSYCYLDIIQAMAERMKKHGISYLDIISDFSKSEDAKAYVLDSVDLANQDYNGRW